MKPTPAMSVLRLTQKVIPIEQGLKLQLHEKDSVALAATQKVIPIEQGLKHYIVGIKIVYPITQKVIPIEQGLKQAFLAGLPSH